MAFSKGDFPIFKNHPELVFLDSTSTTQKPQYVIDGMSDFFSHSYANIHRGLYDIAQESERLYFESKKKFAQFIGRDDYKEIIYTANANYAINLIAQTLRYNGFFKKWDKVLLSVAEHHANIVPWQILQQEIGIELVFFGLDENGELDFQDFKQKYTSDVKMIALSHVSNVTGQIFSVDCIGRWKRDDTLFLVDASQSIAHIPVKTDEICCDFLVCTAHKLFADTGLGIIWAKKLLLWTLKPVFSGGGAILSVKESGFEPAGLPYTFEPGTPHISGAVSLLKALEYIEQNGGIDGIETQEKPLVEYACEQFDNRRKYLNLLGEYSHTKRVGVFSFTIDDVHSYDIADTLAEHHICVRAGKHCAEPLSEYFGVNHSVRMSLGVYNTKEDIDAFFKVLDDNFLPWADRS